MTLNYYFQLEFQWKNDWFSKTGLAKPIIRASNEVLRKEYVDYSIFESIFHYNKKLQNSSSTEKLLNELKSGLNSNSKITTSFYNEVVDLEINAEFCCPIDLLGSVDGIGAPLNWNLQTPKHLQYVPTYEILNLFEDWLKFLIVLETKPPSI